MSGKAVHRLVTGCESIEASWTGGFLSIERSHSPMSTPMADQCSDSEYLDIVPKPC